MTYNVVPIHTTKMLRGLKKAVALASSCVVVATVAYFFAHNGAASKEESKPDGLKSLTSPSGQFQAILLTWAGGGGISPYCNEALLVTPSSKSQQQAELEKRYEVYSSECGEFADHSPSPKITWRSDDVLSVTFSINTTAAGPTNVRLKKIDASGRVRIEFEAKE
ncbi:hypothetical protein [Caballeronia grimmiae]|uniref:Uncharacterized protein n=1 Tax=Caballeronia grimmiae TaxID=1071679 RepID=A0A069NAG3_9BURK|nr:hypothetical protein [Caballeronia grimmiae]KDR25350.1 hypothetical protein BG57_30685 [Caballeronia grimmiae]GGD74556.1 hypothetical protein GCM10010985_31290 [Caballeronia grimmiae]